MKNSALKVVPVQTKAQLDACFSIRFKVFVEEQQVPADIEIDEYDASPEACRHFLLKDGDTPVATGRWKPFEGKAAKLQRIAVLQEYRGQGAGRQVLQVLEDDAAAHGCTSAVLDGQTQAEAFYRKLGYETISEEPFLDAGIWHVRMRKTLG